MHESERVEREQLAVEFALMYTLIEYAARRYYGIEREHSEWVDLGGES